MSWFENTLTEMHRHINEKGTMYLLGITRNTETLKEITLWPS
jgi:hypothetical protein